MCMCVCDVISFVVLGFGLSPLLIGKNNECLCFSHFEWMPFLLMWAHREKRDSLSFIACECVWLCVWGPFLRCLTLWYEHGAREHIQAAAAVCIISNFRPLITALIYFASQLFIRAYIRTAHTHTRNTHTRHENQVQKIKQHRVTSRTNSQKLLTCSQSVPTTATEALNSSVRVN